MPESADGTKRGFVEGTSISIDDLHGQSEIPREEIASYRDLIRIYPNGEIIIQEGDQEHALYLLRVGTVEVFKGSGAAQDAMGTIDAVNFFGEMSMINDEPRSATVRASSKDVVVYRIPNPSIHTILTNPQWAEMLIVRLSKNLARSVEQHFIVAEQLKELRAEVEQLKSELKNRPAR